MGILDFPEDAEVPDGSSVASANSMNMEGKGHLSCSSGTSKELPNNPRQEQKLGLYKDNVCCYEVEIRRDHLKNPNFNCQKSA